MLGANIIPFYLNRNIINEHRVREPKSTSGAQFPTLAEYHDENERLVVRMYHLYLYRKVERTG